MILPQVDGVSFLNFAGFISMILPQLKQYVHIFKKQPCLSKAIIGEIILAVLEIFNTANILI